MRTVAIVDDNRQHAEALRGLLLAGPHADELAVELYDSALTFERVAATRLPDVLFMDIVLDDASPMAGAGKSGAAGAVTAGAAPALQRDAAPNGIDEVERLVLGSGTQVIYMSAYDAYHTQVYRTPHACYLRKPLRKADVETALDTALQRLARCADRPLRLRARGVERVVRPQEILYLESDLRLVRVHLRDDVVEAYGKLSDLARMLPNRFVRCHQSFLVNLDYVAGLDAAALRLTDGSELPVSRRHRAAVRDALFAHVRSGC